MLVKIGFLILLLQVAPGTLKDWYEEALEDQECITYDYCISDIDKAQEKADPYFEKHTNKEIYFWWYSVTHLYEENIDLNKLIDEGPEKCKKFRLEQKNINSKIDDHCGLFNYSRLPSDAVYKNYRNLTELVNSTSPIDEQRQYCRSLVDNLNYLCEFTEFINSPKCNYRNVFKEMFKEPWQKCVNEHCITYEYCISDIDKAKAETVALERKHGRKHQYFADDSDTFVRVKVKVLNTLIDDGPEKCKKFRLEESSSKYLKEIDTDCGFFDENRLPNATAVNNFLKFSAANSTSPIDEQQGLCKGLSGYFAFICEISERIISPICNYTIPFDKLFEKPWRTCVKNVKY